jgi:hypothetical protein
MKKAILILFLAIATVRGDPIGNTLSPPVMSGTGSPEGVVTGTPGTLYRNISGGAGITLYTKESGTGNTGWVAYGPTGAAGAPTTATYITQTANGSLSAEQALSTLANGFVFVTNGPVLSSFTIESRIGTRSVPIPGSSRGGHRRKSHWPSPLTYSVIGSVASEASSPESPVRHSMPVPTHHDTAATATGTGDPETDGGI